MRCSTPAASGSLFVYFAEEPQRAMTMRRLSKDDAWQLARAITRIPALLQRD
jgi:hypothetical protein